MDFNAVRKSFSKKLNVPSLPDVVSETISLLESDKAGTRQVGAVVAKDPPLTVKLLRIANSALYGAKTPILSPEHAAAVLGFDGLRNMLLHASVVDMFAHLEKFPNLDLTRLWTESRVCSRIAQQLPGTWSNTVKREDAYLAGLLHNIGCFVLLDQLGEDYIPALEKHWRTGKSLRAIEIDLFQFSHDQVGFIVGRKWGLPVGLLESLRYHLDASGRTDKLPLVGVIHCARILSENLLARGQKKASTLIRPDVLETIGLDSETLNNFAGECRETLSDLEG